MDLMEIRRSLLMTGVEDMANATYKDGTFTGNGTITTTIDIGFEPDDLIVESDLDPAVAWGGGIGFIAFIKNRATLDYYHSGADATTWTTGVMILTDQSNPYGYGGSGS